MSRRRSAVPLPYEMAIRIMNVLGLNSMDWRERDKVSLLINDYRQQLRRSFASKAGHVSRRMSK